MSPDFTAALTAPFLLLKNHHQHACCDKLHHWGPGWPPGTGSPNPTVLQCIILKHPHYHLGLHYYKEVWYGDHWCDRNFSHPLGLLFRLLIGASAFHPWCLHLINLCLCLITWQVLWNRGNHFKSQFCPWYMEEDQVTSGSDFLPVKWMAVLFWRVAGVAKSYASTQHKQKRVNIQTCHWGQEASSTTFPTKQSWKQGFLVLQFPLCDTGVLIFPWEWSNDNMFCSNFPGQACLHGSGTKLRDSIEVPESVLHMNFWNHCSIWDCWEGVYGQEGE